jgi:hypothetical protein
MALNSRWPLASPTLVFRNVSFEFKARGRSATPVHTFAKKQRSGYLRYFATQERCCALTEEAAAAFCSRQGLSHLTLRRRVELFGNRSPTSHYPRRH